MLDVLLTSMVLLAVPQAAEMPRKTVVTESQSAPPANVEAEAPFLTENDTAMRRMMQDMTVAPSGDVDRDFVAMMIPHHQGAIDMAAAVLRYGRNEQVRRLAQEIVVTQRDEIAAMRGAVKGGIGERPAAGDLERPPTPPVSRRDRVYAAEQFSNTVSVTDPSTNTLLGVIRLGDPSPGVLSPLYRGQALVHGLGFSPDHRTLAVVSIGSNSVTFIDTATNSVLHTTYVGRSPHEAFFTPDGREVWVTVRGEDYVSVIDSRSHDEKMRIKVAPGPGMQIFSPDGKFGYVCSSFTPEVSVISVPEHRVVGRVGQESPFCPNIAVTPEGDQVWFTLKDVGKVQAFEARPPFRPLKTLDTGPITNHVNFARTVNGTFAYVTVGGTNEVKVYRTGDFQRVATIAVGRLPHGLWPSGDGSRMYIGLENDDALAAIDTRTNSVIATVPIGQAPQAVVYVPEAVPEGTEATGLAPLAGSGHATQLELRPATAGAGIATRVTLFDEGLIQVVQAAVTGLKPKSPYVLALAVSPDGAAPLEPLAAFTTNPSGAAVVGTVGPIRQLVGSTTPTSRRYLVIAGGTPDSLGEPVQVQVP
jgi:YVTN family beta-propeller protein